MADFEKLDILSASEGVYRALLSRIVSGELKAGTRLPSEREMAMQLGVSRSTLHQAILALEAEGFLTILPRRGTEVCDYRHHPTAKSLEVIMNYGSVDVDHPLFLDLMDTRLWLETECARRAVTNIFTSTLTEMQELVNQMERPGADVPDLVYRFHYKLTQASGNSIYTMIYQGFEAVLRTMIQTRYALGNIDLKETVRLHNALLDAIRSGDPDTSVAALRASVTPGIHDLEKRYD